jgi:hypothetical protein
LYLWNCALSLTISVAGNECMISGLVE